MACQAIHSWTFSDLIGAFLDLFITYFLLCGSTLAFFASKFLSIFGLYLPCPCNGLFSDPSGRNCLERFLVDTPIKKISSVQMSVKSKFPFDSILMRDHQGGSVNVKLIKDIDRAETEGEASCSSFSDVRSQKKNELVRFGSVNSQALQKVLDDYKGKGVFNQRPRPGTLRRRRRTLGNGNRMIRRESIHSSLSSGRIGQEIVTDEECSLPAEGVRGQQDNETHGGIQSDEGPQHSFQWNDFMGESKNSERDESSASDVVRNVHQEMGSDKSELNAIRVLEQALEEEHAARAALYQDLEKERNAAATAADEAMAMILRLQKEKASTEMESRQYQRMIEEKSAYDEEEMNILKEILLRREREKHFLEKEVEAYRQMMALGNEELMGLSTQRSRMSLDSSDDPALMLQQISAYIDKKEMVKNMRNSSDYDTLSVEKHGRILAFEEDLPSKHHNEIDNLFRQGDLRRSLKNEKYYGHGGDSIDESNQEFHEKGLLPEDEHPSDQHVQWLLAEADSRFHGSQEQESLEKTIVVDEEQGKNDKAALCQGITKTNDQTRKDEIIFPCNGAYMEYDRSDADQDGIYNHAAVLEAEPTVLDVHVIDHNMLCDQGSEKTTASPLRAAVTDRCTEFGVQSETSGSRSVDILSDLPSAGKEEAQSYMRRSMSDMRSVSDKIQGKTLLSDMRRNSISSVDYERMKLESEVGWLRDRLKIVQEGREKLSFSVEHKEREKLHLQLLDDIARQLREIRQLTEPGKAARQASLPPSSSKVGSKKRRCRSVSLGIHGSS